MCDDTPFRDWLLAAAAALATAIGLIVAAAVLNGSLFLAPGSPALMVAAGIAVSAAGFAVDRARAAVIDFYDCLRRNALTGDECAGDRSNLLNALAAMIGALAVLSAACFGAAGIAWLPWGAQPAMWWIIAALGAQVVLIPLMFVYVGALRACLSKLDLGSPTAVFIRPAAGPPARSADRTIVDPP